MDPLISASARKHQMERIPLSFAQQQLWLQEQLSPGSCAYTIPLALRLNGSLYVNALTDALIQIIQRHEALRTFFVLQEGKPSQVVTSVPSSILTQIDLSDIPVTKRESILREKVQSELQSSFDLSTGPLFRAKLFRLQEQEHFLLFCMHHIIFDGWSTAVFLQDLFDLYQINICNTITPLPPLPLQYADFAIWQRKHQYKEILQHLDYWKQQLSDAPMLLTLPIARPRPKAQSLQGESITFVISDIVTQALRRISWQEGVTLFMTLLAAFQGLLFRYTGQEDIVIGTLTANRAQRQIEDLIGFFVNIIVIRTNLSGNPTVRELLARVREVCLEAYEHQDMPFEQLVETLNPKRDPSYHPLIQVLFILQNAPTAHPSIPELNVSFEDVETHTSKFDLTLEFTETNGGLVGKLEYCTDLFDSITIARLIGHFQTLLTSMVDELDQAISNVPLLTDAESHSMLIKWNATHVSYPQERTIHQLFEEQVTRTPGAIAINFGEMQLTYDGLNRRANQLAHYLQYKGIGSGTLVGICLPRSLDMVVAMLAVLKAGGAYVPLDPAHPAERLKFILHDSNATLVITSNKVDVVFREDKIVCLENENVTIATFADYGFASSIRACDLAYVIYTSGSTGKPKGVAIEHRSTANLLYWAQSTFSCKELSTVLASTSICFDLSIFEIFVPLCWGGHVLLVENVLQLSQVSHIWNVTLINTVPSLLKDLLRSQKIPASVCTVNLAGEPFSPKLLQSLYAQDHSQRIINLYGPTETTTYSSWAELGSDTLGNPPIGCPISNTQLYVLDSHQQPVPIGVPGELYIAGAGLARGYWNRKELTRERFVPHPFGSDPEARMYRTGDIARYLPNGQMELLGRMDQQVKIRGFRIELGEIETALNEHPAVSQAVVLVGEKITQNQYLVGYILTQQQTLSAEELRSYLQQKLPSYMLPAKFIFLNAFPLNPNGKVDRASLAHHNSDNVELDLEKQLVAARDTWEGLLVDIWEDTLNLHPISVKDNFFEIGGTSLDAINVVIQVQQKLEKTLSLTSFLTQGTIEGLATTLREQVAYEQISPLVKIQAGQRKLPLFLVHALGGLGINFISLARSIGSDIPVYAIQSRGIDGRSEPLDTVEAMARYYIDTIRDIQPEGPYFLGGASMGGYIVFEMAQQLQASGYEVALLAMFDTANRTPEHPEPLDDAACWFWAFGSTIPLSLNHLKHLSSEQQLDHVFSLLRSSPEYQYAESPKRRRMWLPNARSLLKVEKSNAHAYLKYVRQLYPGRVMLFRATEQPQNVREEAYLGWNEIALGGVEIHNVPGDHLSLLQKPNVEIVAQKLRSYVLQRLE